MANPYFYNALVNKIDPTIVCWNRLEGRPRSADFSRALKAEVRDALWMISKQRMLGGFKGEDCGSIVSAKIHAKTTGLTKYQSEEGSSKSFPSDIPLEVEVEKQKIPFKSGAQEISLDIRLLMGRQWLKMLDKNQPGLRSFFIDNYTITSPDPNEESHAQVCGHIEVWQKYEAVANRSIDGYRVYQDMKSGVFSSNINIPDGKLEEFNKLANKFIKWFENLYYQPKEDETQAWKPSYLEYQFDCSAPESEKAEKVFTASEYYHGNLDWYNLDISKEKSKIDLTKESKTNQDVRKTFTQTLDPSPIIFPGMPDNRWWTFEDSKTNLGNIKPDTTDINQLMLLDFVLNYSNDWFLVPITFPIGSIVNIEGIVTRNSFGERFWIEPTGQGSDEDWQKWSMFHLNTKGDMDIPSDMSLVLLPVAAKVMEGKPLEEIYLIRDEVANMVWGIESIVQLATGQSKRGKEAALELKAKYEKLFNIIPANNQESQGTVSKNDAKIKYQIVNSVSENWIPFIPVHKAGDRRNIQLQRTAMPRILKGGGNINPPEKIEPRTSILREGLDVDIKEAYFIHEEEIPRSGILVRKTYQRTRWTNGEVFTWLGTRKLVGRGEGNSGLAFDQILSFE